MIIHWLSTSTSQTSIALGEIDGSSEVMLSGFDEKYPDRAQLLKTKKLEYLASRQLVEALCRQMKIAFDGIEKDEFGKPHLTNSTYHLSISHSYPMVACAINATQSCGIDIESPREQLARIKHKFLSEKELSFCGNSIEMLCLHWSGKETLYKIYGRKQLLFAEQLLIHTIEGNRLTGEIKTNHSESSYILEYNKFDEYFIVYNI